MKPTIFAEMEKKLLIAVFGCLSESDPVVASTVWEAALHIVVNFEVSLLSLVFELYLILKYETNVG